MLSGQHAATWEEILHHKDSSVTLGSAARLAHFDLFEGYAVGGFLAAFGFPGSGVRAMHSFCSPDLLRSVVVASSGWSRVGYGCRVLEFIVLYQAGSTGTGRGILEERRLRGMKSGLEIPINCCEPSFTWC